MKDKKPNAALVWKQMEDLLAPQMNFSLADRAIYSHLFRHSRLVGKPQIRFSISWLARGVGLSPKCARATVRRLISRGVFYLVERNYTAHHVVRVRLPLEVKGVHGVKTLAQRPAPVLRVAVNIEEMDFLEKQNLRRAIHERERGHCFYCLRRINRRSRCLDHVVPLAKLGGNSYRNLVSCCPDCNSQKGERSAEEHLRTLFRERRLDNTELNGRLRALDDLAAGKLKPLLPGQQSIEK